MFKKMTVLCLMVVMCFNFASFADTSTPNYGGFATEKELVSYLSDNNVPKNKIKSLVEKSLNDIQWDCYKEEKLALLPADFYEFDLASNIGEKYFRFEDGSFTKVYVGGGEVIKNYREVSQFDKSNLLSGLNRAAVSDSFGTLYKNHRIERIVGTTRAYFIANFYVPRPGYGSSIIYTTDNSNNMYNSPYGEGISGFGVTGHPEKEMIRDVEYNGQAALFRLYWFNQIEVSGGWDGFGASAAIGSTCNLYLALVNNKVYIASSLPF